MYFNVIRHQDQLCAYERQWRRLELTTPFQSIHWLQNWARYLATDDVEFCLIVGHEENGDWVGVAPFCLESGLGRRLRFINANNAAPSANRFLAVAGRYSEFIGELTAWLSISENTKPLLGSLDAIVLDGVGLYDPAIEQLQQRFRELKFRFHYSQSPNRWHLPLPDNFDAFVEGLDPELASHCGSWIEFVDSQITTRTSSDYDASQLWNAFVKMRIGDEPLIDDRFADDRYLNFLRQSVCRMCDDSHAQIKINYLGENPISGLILLNTQHLVHICEMAVSPFATMSGIVEWSVLETIRAAIHAGYESVEFPSGEATYKSMWNSEVVQSSRITLVPPTLAARIKNSIRVSSENLFQTLTLLGTPSSR